MNIDTAKITTKNTECRNEGIAQAYHNQNVTNYPHIIRRTIIIPYKLVEKHEKARQFASCALVADREYFRLTPTRNGRYSMRKTDRL